MSSEQELFNTKARLEALKEINDASVTSLSLAQQMADFAQKEQEYKSGILEDTRTGSDLAKEIAEMSLASKEAEAEKMKLYRAGKVDAAVQLGIMAKQNQKRIEELKTVQKTRDAQIETAEAIKKVRQGLNTVVASAMSTAGLFNTIKNVIMEASTLTVGFSKALGVSQDEVMAIRDGFMDIEDGANNSAINVISLQKSFMSLNETFGTAASVMRDDIVLETTKLIRLTDMSAGSAANFAKFANISGKNMSVVTKEARAAVVAGEKEAGVRLNINKILDEAGKITGVISAQLGGNPAKIAKSVAVAKQFGMELSKVAAAGRTLLDFESSISNELEAELLLGKNINLERARLAALTGDYETLTKEINKNVGDFSDFSKLNVLQQEALAKSVGMTADALADQLLSKANLAELAQEARDNDDLELAKTLEAQDLAQKFANIQERIQGILVQNGDQIARLVEGIVGLVDNAGVLKGVLAAVAAMKFAGVISQIITMVTSLTAAAAAATATNAATTFGAGTVAVIASVAAVLGLLGGLAVNMAEGGVVMPRAGGTLARIGEAGQAEAVIPLDRAQSMGFGGEIDYDKMAEAVSKANVNVNVATVSNSFDTKSTMAGEGEYSSDVKYDSPFA